VTEVVIEAVEGAPGLPWGLVALFVAAALDAVLPLVPSESSVISAGVLAVGGETSLPLVILAAALGAAAGDHVSYLVGRRTGGRLGGPPGAGGRRRAALRWARGALAERGGSIIVVCRFIPGARTAVTLTAGGVHHPLRSFSSFDAIAVLAWATRGRGGRGGRHRARPGRARPPARAGRRDPGPDQGPDGRDRCHGRRRCRQHEPTEVPQ
jgi:membrane protein DedA with SNARE-associated domain